MAEQVRLTALTRPALPRFPSSGAAEGGALRHLRSVVLAQVRRATILAMTALLAVTSPAPAQTGTSAAAIALSPGGDRLGPITAQTRFSAAELSSLFPGAVVTEATGASEGETFPILRIADGDRVLLEVRSAGGVQIHSVEIMADAAVSNLGMRHGESYAEVFGAGASPACVPGVEEQSGQAVCPAPSSDHVSLVFAGTWDGPDGELPPPEVLRDWTVERVIWRP